MPERPLLILPAPGEDVARITTRGATLAMVLGLAVPILTALLVWALGTR